MASGQYLRENDVFDVAGLILTSDFFDEGKNFLAKISYICVNKFVDI